MGGGGPIKTITNAVSSAANAVGGAISNVPVVGGVVGAGVKGVGQAVDATINGVVAVPKGVVAIAEGQNVFTSTGEAVTGVVAGGVGAASAPSIAVFNSVTPTGVQELPIVSNVETLNTASLNIANQGDYSSGALENFYRNGAELGAIAVTAGAAGGAVGGGEAGGEAVGTDVGASVGTDVAAASAEDTITVTSAQAVTAGDLTAGDLAVSDVPLAGVGDGVSAGAVTSTDIAAEGAAGGGSSILSTAETVAASTGALTLGEKFLGSKLPPLADQILGLPEPDQPQPTKTIVKPGGNSTGSSPSYNGGLGMTPAQASILVAAGIAAVVILKARG